MKILKIKCGNQPILEIIPPHAQGRSLTNNNIPAIYAVKAHIKIKLNKRPFILTRGISIKIATTTSARGNIHDTVPLIYFVTGERANTFSNES
ncbi:MAG: hypothetical protein BGO52_11690 [Sphingobacteriales bacterium 44-61]|nr:MAG: hypothetical protein BGO52_11690 [Sphingobacteriales bacterium 44-61]